MKRVKLNGHVRVRLNGHTGPPAKRGRGQPTLYRSEYCGEIVEFCAQGVSLTAYAGHLGVDRSTLFRWGEAHPEFFNALSQAKSAAVAWWEQILRSIGKDGGQSSRATAAIFALRNLGGDEWRDAARHEVGGKDGGPINLLSLTVTPQDLNHARQLVDRQEAKT